MAVAYTYNCKGVKTLLAVGAWRSIQKGKKKKVEYMPISWVLGDKTTSDNATDYRHRDKIIEICEEYRTRINRLYMELRSADEQEREIIYDRIADEKAERDKKVSKWLTSENVLKFVIRHYEKNRPSDWRIYAPIVNTPLFKKYLQRTALPYFGKRQAYKPTYQRAIFDESED